MSLLDRYLNAVRKHLPRQTRDDIVAELRDALLSQIEAEQAERGRTLTDDEVGAILKRYGAPEAVAARYGARGHLIGPAVFPHYAFVVKLVLWILVPVASLWAVGTALTANDPVRSTAIVIWISGTILLVNLALVTLVFARLERFRNQVDVTESWDPRLLPPDPGRPIPRAESVAALILMMFWLLWWTGVLPVNAWIGRLNTWLGGAPLPLALAPIWDALSPAIIAVMIAGIVLDLIAIARPRWVRIYEGGGLLIDVAILAVLYQLLRARELVVVTDPHAAGAGLVALAHSGLFAGLLLWALLAGVDAGFTVRRLRSLRYGLSEASRVDA